MTSEDTTIETQTDPNPQVSDEENANDPNPQVSDAETEETEEETFPRSYVEKLREEAAKHRTRAARADELAAALWSARVAATGRLADPTDLAMPEGVDPLDADAVTEAVDELLARKPHLASRTPRGEVGSGATGGDSGAVDIAGLLRARA